MASRIEPPMRAVSERIRDFTEVKGGYQPHEAIAEASRCLFCADAPCTDACPAGVDVASFIRKVKTKAFRGAIRTIRDGNLFAGSCARICPQEESCEKACSATDLAEPINIGALQRFAADWEMAKGVKALKHAPSNGVKVAVIGAGPAGLVCAAELARKGYEPVVFEASDTAGGVLALTLPRYRLPREVLEAEIGLVTGLGVEINYSTPCGSVGELFEKGYKAVFIGTGTMEPFRLGIPGEDLRGVINAMDLLGAAARDDASKIGHSVVVIGAGNVAMDAAGCAVRLGAETVDLISLESFEEMPAFPSEVDFTKDEGARFHPRSRPVAFHGDDEGKVRGVSATGIRWQEPGRFTPDNAEVIEGSAFELEADTVIIAIGQGPSRAAFTGEIERDARGYILCNEEMMTSMDGAFAGGDIVAGAPGTVVGAVGHGKVAAASMVKWLEGGV